MRLAIYVLHFLLLYIYIYIYTHTHTYIYDENLFGKSNDYFLKKVLNILKMKQSWYKTNVNVKKVYKLNQIKHSY